MLSIPARHTSYELRVLFDPLYEHMILKHMQYIMQFGLPRPGQMLSIPAMRFASGWLSVASVLHYFDLCLAFSEAQAKMQINISILHRIMFLSIFSNYSDPASFRVWHSQKCKQQCKSTLPYGLEICLFNTFGYYSGHISIRV